MMQAKILQLLRDFYNATLSEKPEDIFQYAADWFGVYKQNWYLITYFCRKNKYIFLEIFDCLILECLCYAIRCCESIKIYSKLFLMLQWEIK